LFQLFESFADCLARTGDALVVVDIPIGSLEQARPGGGQCDQQARDALGWPRRNSVFSPSARPALYATEYREAIELNGQGLSK
jgi:predicted RNase H-like nuclease